MNRMKKIQSKIVTVIVLAIFIAATINAVVGGGITRFSTFTALEKTMSETAEVAALAAQNMISTYTSTISEIATNPILTSLESTDKERQEFIDEKVATYYMRYGGFADVGGYDEYHQYDVSAEAFFQKSIAGETYMSTPYILSNGTDCCLIVSAPVYNQDSIIGILYFSCDTYILQSIIESVEIGELGDSYVLDSTGTTIAYNDLTNVLAKENIIAQSKEQPKDKGLKSLAAIEQEMIAGKTDVKTYTYQDGRKYIQSYTPIPGTDGWSIAITIDEKEFMHSALIGNLVQLAILILIIFIGLLAAVRIGRSIADPIVKCTKRLKLLAKGDLHTPMPDVTTQDEVKTLAESMNDLTESFRSILKEAGSTLEKIADGDLTENSLQVSYPGDFAVLQDYFRMIHQKLNETMHGIVTAANQVSTGAEQVSYTGSILANGSSDQANAIELLSGDIGKLSVGISNTAKGAEDAKSVSSTAKQQLLNGVTAMNHLIKSVQDIEKKSDEISKIIMNIEEIASQTNILALNAAIEAARAGESGKGFAIIADNVRELAVKSAAATQSTADLIHQTVDATHKGSELAEVTSRELQQVIEGAAVSVSHIEHIADEVIRQSEAVSLINERVEEISSVVESNTASSEESAATAEELSRQADIMKKLVSKFRLDDSFKENLLP